jgi:protein ImuA
MNTRPSRGISFLPERSDIWRGSELGQAGQATLPTGHAALDAQLPGGGWPAAGLVELLQDQPARHDWRLLLPMLVALVRPAMAQGVEPKGPVLLVGAPEAPAGPMPPGQATSPGRLMPFGPALAAQGLPLERLLWVHASAAAARLWACEQALRCAEVLAVLAWLPRLRADALRRLHLCAIEHGRPLFVFRPASARHEPSAAPLRLLLEGADDLRVHVLKRRGPPLSRPVLLGAHGPRLAALLASRRTAGRPELQASPPPVVEVLHALDRAAAA